MIVREVRDGANRASNTPGTIDGRREMYKLALVAPVFVLPTRNALYESLYLRGAEDAELWLESDSTKNGEFGTKSLFLVGERWIGHRDMRSQQITDIFGSVRGVTTLEVVSVDDLDFAGFFAPGLQRTSYDLFRPNDRY